MTILFLALAVAFAAFCVWLTVRIINRRERWAKWTAVGLAVVLAYPLGIGPAFMLVGQKWCPIWLRDAILDFYLPLLHMADHLPQPLQDALLKWLFFWIG